jgi:hypothetical protein
MCSDAGSVNANLAGPPIAGLRAVCSSGEIKEYLLRFQIGSMIGRF